jgi:hypothetical protein
LKAARRERQYREATCPPPVRVCPILGRVNR